MKTIRITAGKVSLIAELNDGPTAAKLWDALPIQGTANTWGDEIYFGIPVRAEEEASASADVEVGDLGYWPPGHAFCIFFGPTPASRSEKPRAASPVNLVGRVVGDASSLRNVQDGEKVRIEQAEP
jgi:hypothetical protein